MAIELDEELYLAAIFSTRAEIRLEEILLEESFTMVIDVKPETDELPSAPILRSCEQHLAERATQQQESQAHLVTWSQEQQQLIHEQQTIAAHLKDMEHVTLL